RQDDLADNRRAGVDTRHQRFDVEISGADSIDRGDHAAEHMIQTVVLGSIFDGHNVAHIFDDTDNVSVAFRSAAYGALLVVGNIVTRPAKTDLRAETVERFR